MDRVLEGLGQAAIRGCPKDLRRVSGCPSKSGTSRTRRSYAAVPSAAWALDPDRRATTGAANRCASLYRILFLLYAEASPEMKCCPQARLSTPRGYGLDRLRSELTLTELVSPTAKSGTHLYQSLPPCSSWLTGAPARAAGGRHRRRPGTGLSSTLRARPVRPGRHRADR